MATAKEHIEEIRRSKFSIGGGKVNPLTEDLHQAVKNLSAELYAKDVHFLMELIQNAEDNEYNNMEGAVPSLEFVITSRDITATGAQATLLIFNNEKGFSPKNIDSICSVGRSTKKGANRKHGGYIGEKGIGFKSVFLITAHPYIFSNGYQIRFNEDPCPHCNVGFIVPEWVEANPTLSDIQFIYGSDKILPTTTIILPLKSDKINPVKQQLSDLHPEILLFLSKIKSLSFKEDNHEDPSLNTVNRIAISSETNCAMRKNIDAESYMLHLSTEGNSVPSIGHCSYYMWKQKFRVRPENRVERRMEVDEFWITLAFPLAERLHDRGMNNPGVYAFLPTEMVTNFPFIIQADFVLASSRETILLDDKWNQGILEFVPSAFISAFTSLVKSSASAPLSSLPPMFRFIPVTGSSYHKFDLIREAIRTKLIEEDIIPSESFTDQKFFHKPREVGRLMPAFWSILKDARAQGVSLHNLSSHGKFILSSSFDSSKYDTVLNFLGVQEVGDEWYAKFLVGSSLILEVAEDVYVKLLVFISGNWMSKFQSYTSMRTLPLVKYVDPNGDVSLCSVDESASKVRAICLSSKFNQSSWLIDWNKEFRCRSGRCFVPTSMEVAIRFCNDKERVLEWLNTHVKAVSVDVYDYAVGLLPFYNSDLNLVVTCAHFLYHSYLKDYISEASVSELCGTLPLVDNSRRVITTRRGVLVPGKGSKWVELMGSNPWSREGYVELGEAYLKQGHFAGEHTPGKQLIEFLRKCVGASDIPHINPPNSGIPAVSGPLTQANALLLLEWIRNLKFKRSHFPDEFLRSIKCGNWLRVTLSGSPGCRPPSESFFPTVAWGKIFQNMAVLIDVPLIDQGFYGVSMIEDYREELKMLGVMSEYGEACEYIGKHLMSLASSSSSMTLTRSNVLSILHFIRFLRDKYLPVENFVSSINRSSWLKTTHGIKSPVGSVLFDEGWRTAAEISNIPFLDKNFYGEKIYHFKDELKLLGVDVDLENKHRIIVDYLKPSCELNALKPEVFLLMLQCIHCSSTSRDKVVRSLENRRCVKTNSGGFNSPDKCFFPDPEMGCLLQVFDSIPVVDMSFYGDGILNYRREMKELKVVADVDAAVKEFCRIFRQRASSSSSSITKENVISFLACYRKLSKNRCLYLSDLRQCITEVQWLRTKLGDYRSPRNCILYGKDWKSISEICRLPLLDDREEFYGEEIQQYMKELKSIGVVVELRDGIDFVISGLRLPTEHVSRRVTPDNVLALLECIRIYLKEKEKETLPEAFLSKVGSQDWLKTHAGYFPPDRCCLYDPLWAPYLKPTDGPFIDEEFYLGAASKGGMIRDFRKELHALGVIVDVKEACHLMAAHLYSHSDTGTIMRIYNFLIHFGWKTADEEEESHQNSRLPWRSVWIPPPIESSREQGAAAAGRWASPEKCVLHDKDELFGSSQLSVLDKHYGSRYLGFFSRAFGVKLNPSIDDYYKLWKEWEVSRDSLSKSECCAFWGYVARHWSSKVEKMLVQDQGGGLTKLPVEDSSSGGNHQVVQLSDKRDVFIADDLLLKDIFQQASPRPVFVWYPKRSTGGGHHQVVPPNRVKLHEIYSKIGVKTISQASVSVPPSLLLLPPPPQTEKSSCSNMEVEKRGLVKFILSFLANPPINMEVEKRHEAVKCLANATIFEPVEPITVCYELPLLSSGEVVRGTASQMVRWERERKEGSKLFMQKRPCSSSHQKNLIEYAQHFGEEISQGVLWGDEKEDNISALSELIKFGYLLEFDEEAMDFLMKSKNLQVYDEDVEFLCSSIFHSN